MSRVQTLPPAWCLPRSLRGSHAKSANLTSLRATHTLLVHWVISMLFKRSRPKGRTVKFTAKFVPPLVKADTLQSVQQRWQLLLSMGQQSSRYCAQGLHWLTVAMRRVQARLPLWCWPRLFLGSQQFLEFPRKPHAGFSLIHSCATLIRWRGIWLASGSRISESKSWAV